MKILLSLIAIVFALNSNAQKEPTKFSQEALTNICYTLDGKTINFEQVLEKYKGKKILFDMWASWCPDCIKGLPKMEKLIKKHKNNNIVFVYLDVDKDQNKWKKAVKKYSIEGEHFRVEGLRKGKLGQFLNITWIPRYFIVDENGDIELFNAIVADDPKISTILQKL